MISKNNGKTKGRVKKINKTPIKQSVVQSNATVKNHSLVSLKPLPLTVFKADKAITSYSLFLRKQEKDRFKQQIKVSLRDKYKTTYNNLQKRLHTDQPTDDCKAIADIDPDFFTCVGGAILNKYILPFKTLKYTINSRLRTKIEIGYRNDCMLNIDINREKEQDIYLITVERYKTQVKLLDEFISYDYKKSIESLDSWDLLKIAVNNKTNELHDLANKEFTLTSNIIGLDYKYSLQQKYGRFLYYLSPPSWRFRNRYFARSVEIEAKGFDFGSSSEEDKFIVIFEKLKQECEVGLLEPPLYFQQPQDLMEIFQSIEMQNLHHFTHVARSRPHTVFLKKGIKLFKDIISQESSGILKTIDDFEQSIQFKEEHCCELQTKFFKILNGLFYESVGEIDVLKLQLHLEFCFEKVLNEKPINMDIIGMAKALEGFYLDFSERLEAVTASDIKAAIVQYETSERLKFRRGKDAAKELRLFERMERVLIRAHEPPATSQPRQTASFSVVRTGRRKAQAKSKYDDTRKRLSEAQMEYLTVFTDWTEKDDPANYVHNLDDKDITKE